MRILITGHRGFIGSHLWPELHSFGHELFGADIAHSYPDAPCDLTQDGEIEKTLDLARPELVIHLAAQVGRLRGEDDLRHTLRENVEMTAVLAHACGNRRIRVLYASSSEVYGDQGDATCYEVTPPVLPHNAYGLSKRQGEEFLRLYAPKGLQIVRLSMPYGPGAPPGRGRRALDNILHQAHHGQRIPIHKHAERSWCWIGDTVAGIRLVLEEGEEYAHRADDSGGVYNIGRDDQPISMRDLALACCALVGADPDLIDMVDPPAAQTVVKRLATDKLRGLGWEPLTELDEGLPQVYEWIKGFDVDGLPIERRCRVCGDPITPPAREHNICPVHGG